MRLTANESNAETIRDNFWPDSGSFAKYFSARRPMFMVLPISGRTSGVNGKQAPLGDQRIGLARQCERQRRVPGQPWVVHLTHEHLE